MDKAGKAGVDYVMREIEFRMWDKETQSFLYIKQMNSNETVQAEHILHDGKLEQYTGLKDKHGKKIFEGDNLEFDDKQIGGIKGIGKVIWCDKLLYVNAPGYYLEFKGRITSFPFNCKIIGNAFENPELVSDGGVE